ncbi:SDR family NAD(P)-dependent oxidoreductase [Microbacterium sp. 18062]|uniref:SDR family NAD(P)-dependent oxidoreductase n=1 Tax=Microbacterium sp. 18062 TaxID=2681410 RepID=UPI00135A1134|nr:SDR family oxidoreductase [Microbacterium sp. 18062]
MAEMDAPVRGTALVTGGAGGLGFAIARRLAVGGDRVVIADIDETAAAAAAAALAENGTEATGVRLDVTDEADVVEVIARVDARWPLTTVVNNAGVAFSEPLVETTAAQFERLFAVNVTGTFLVLREAVRLMTPRAAGAIVNICSTSSFTASTGPMAAYDASKGALAMLTRATARECARTGIRINGVAPGTMDTALVRGLGESTELLARLAETRIPVGRLGETDEVAAAVEWLASPASSYVLGHILVVDGGWLA